MPDKLNDRWHSRDFPVLLEVARQLDGPENVVESESIARALDMESGDVARAFDALIPSYIDGKIHRSMGNEVYLGIAQRVTERGRRATGLWPNEEAAADALVDLLNQAADQVDDEDDAGALRKAGRMLRGVPSAVLADVTMALIRQQTGLP